jgi:hypothetical protein
MAPQCTPVKTVAALTAACLRALCAGLLLATAARAAESGAVRAQPLRPGEVIVLDGTLSHPAWQRAVPHERFIEKDPVNGATPPQQTRFQVLFDERALYVGVTVLDTDPARIRDPIVRVDQVNRTQDFVVVYVDAIGSKRSAQFFRVNAAGSTADGLHTAADDNEDFSPDFDWDAAVARNPQGWTAVFRLPFASLRFAPGTHDWRIMVARRIPREQFHLAASVPIPRDLPSFIANMQPLQGVALPQDSQFLTLRPSVTLRRDDPAQSSPRNSSSASLDVKWRPRAEAVIDATLQPDFSQVALDVPQLAGNSRFALYFPEKRPFFFESADLLRTPTDAFYTRSFTEPRWGLRGTWRSTDWAGTALTLDDRGGGLVLLPGPYGTDATEQPASRVLAARARSDGGNLQWGGVAASRQYSGGRGDNTVLGPDVAWQINDAWRLRGQWLHASTTAIATARGLQRGAAVDGDRVYLRGYYQTQDTEADFGIDDSTAGFRHDSGFVNQAGVRKWHAFAARGWPNVGPFNRLHINTEFERTTERTSGLVVNEYLRPGLWATGARNLEWWAEYFGHSVLRTAANAPLLRENFVATGVVFTPARWFPILDSKLTLGRLADTVAGEVRPGGTFRLTAKLRPLRQMEFETTANTAWLDAAGQRAYTESALRLLAVWHFNARHNLRAIVDRTSLTRRAEAATGSRPAVLAERGTGQTGSLTYAWRESAGTLLYVGASSATRGPGAATRSQEMFVKLQVDVDEARGWWRR